MGGLQGIWKQPDKRDYDNPVSLVSVYFARH